MWNSEDVDPEMKKLYEQNRNFSYTSPPTTKINNFTIRLLENFWKEANLKGPISHPLPIDTTMAFFDWLAYQKRISLGSISDCVYRALIRLALLNKKEVSAAWRRACIEKFNQYKADKKVKQPGKGNTAITVAVWNCILDRVPCNSSCGLY